MRADLNWLADMTEEQAAAEMARFRRVVERRYEDALAGKLSHRTDRAARRGLRGRKASR